MEEDNEICPTPIMNEYDNWCAEFDVNYDELKNYKNDNILRESQETWQSEIGESVQRHSKVVVNNENNPSEEYSNINAATNLDPDAIFNLGYEAFQSAINTDLEPKDSGLLEQRHCNITWINSVFSRKPEIRHFGQTIVLESNIANINKVWNSKEIILGEYPNSRQNKNVVFQNCGQERNVCNLAKCPNVSNKEPMKKIGQHDLIKDNTRSLFPVLTELKRFPCEHCDKTFAYIYQLKRHSRVHSGDKPFACDVCHKTFTVKGSLMIHTRIHSGEKPYSCDFCGRKFSHWSSLHAHKFMHTDEKPFKCDDCGNTFRDKCTLKAHAVVHTGQKPFKCEHCNKFFSNRGSIWKHQRTHKTK